MLPPHVLDLAAVARAWPGRVFQARASSDLSSHYFRRPSSGVKGHARGGPDQRE